MNLRALFLVCTVMLTGVTYAAGNCDSEKDKLKKIVDRCKKLSNSGKNTDACKEEARAQQAKAKDVCEEAKTKATRQAAVGDVSSAEQLEKAIQEWEQTSKTMKCREKKRKEQKQQLLHRFAAMGSAAFQIGRT